MGGNSSSLRFCIYYPWIFQDGLRKTTKRFSLDNLSPGRDLKARLAEYEARQRLSIYYYHYYYLSYHVFFSLVPLFLSQWLTPPLFNYYYYYYYYYHHHHHHHFLSQVFFLPWYFSSWASGEPHHSGFKSQLIIIIHRRL